MLMVQNDFFNKYHFETHCIQKNPFVVFHWIIIQRCVVFAGNFSKTLCNQALKKLCIHFNGLIVDLICKFIFLTFNQSIFRIFLAYCKSKKSQILKIIYFEIY